VPWMAEALELRITDPQGVLIIQTSLRHVMRKYHPPRFRSLRPTDSSSSAPAPSSKRQRSSWYAWLVNLGIETAHAATSDGTALDIAVVGDKYTAGDVALFYQDVDRVLAHFMTYEPYISRASQVLFHRVDNTMVDLGCAYSSTVSRLLTCNSSTVVSVVNDAAAPYDKIIVLVKSAAYGGSGGSIAVSYNGSYAAQVIAHEFGHTFGGLLDEYALYSTNGLLNGTAYANCYAGSPPTADWNGLVALAQYTLGCKYPNWYRSSPCSIMSSVSCPFFNPVSQRQLTAKLDLYAGGTKPTLTFNSSPTLIGLKGFSVLQWTGANLTSCSASGAWSGSRPVSGMESVSPTATSSYTFTCLGSSSTLTQTATVTVDAQIPSVTLITPTNGSVVSGVVPVSASAIDDRGMSRVDFYKGGVLMASDNTLPYGTEWNTTQDVAGSHIISVQGIDIAGNLGTASATVVTAQPLQDTQAPQVVILSPLNEATVSGKVQIKASASDSIGVALLQLYIDGLLRTSTIQSTIGLTWNVRSRSVASGAHTITVKGIDAAGNIGTASITVFK